MKDKPKSRLPVVSYEALEEVLSKVSDVLEKIAQMSKKNKSTTYDEITKLLAKYVEELKEQPAIYEWIITMLQMYQQAGVVPGSAEIILIIVLLLRTFKVQMEIDNLEDLFRDSL